MTLKELGREWGVVARTVARRLKIAGIINFKNKPFAQINLQYKYFISWTVMKLADGLYIFGYKNRLFICESNGDLVRLLSSFKSIRWAMVGKNKSKEKTRPHWQVFKSENGFDFKYKEQKLSCTNKNLHEIINEMGNILYAYYDNRLFELKEDGRVR